MRVLEPGLAAHLASGVTTLCTCWRIVRRDAATLCFTDHDRDIAFDGGVFAAGAGIDGSAAETSLGLATGGSEVAGVLSSAAIAESDLANGLYDGAKVEIWRVNWARPEQRVLLDVHSIGEVRRTTDSFTAELRSLAHAFEQEGGRLYQQQCDADLGDERCGVDLGVAGRRRVTQVTGGDGALELHVAATDFEEGYFDGGSLEVTDGANAGAARTIDACASFGSGSRVRLWRPLPANCAPGDTAVLHPGCDKRFATCRDKFANAARFRGFPHMPGVDALLTHAGNTNLRMDGGSLYA